MTSEDGGGDGSDGFLRDMAAQSARAHDFDRRIRWSRLSRALRVPYVADPAADPAAGTDAETGVETGVVLPEGPVVDLRAVEPATATEAPVVPRQRR